MAGFPLVDSRSRRSSARCTRSRWKVFSPTPSTAGTTARRDGEASDSPRPTCADRVARMATDAFDACVIGSGAGGGAAAWALTRAGLRVLVLERGPHYRAKDFFHDELAV